MGLPVKSKSNYPITISEAKRHLRIEEDYNEDDDYISNLIEAATQKAEQYIGKDIAETSNSLTIYDFASDYINIPEGNFISFDSASEGTVDHIDIFYNYTYVEFTNFVDTDPLTITYTTGYTQGNCPTLVKQAILVKIADLYDVDRQSYTIGSFKENKAFESLLDSFRRVQF